MAWGSVSALNDIVSQQKEKGNFWGKLKGVFAPLFKSPEIPDTIDTNFSSDNGEESTITILMVIVVVVLSVVFAIKMIKK